MIKIVIIILLLFSLAGVTVYFTQFNKTTDDTVKLTCGPGTLKNRDGTKCVVDDRFLQNSGVTCGNGTVKDGDKCIVDENQLNNNTIICGNGTIQDGNKCVVDEDELDGDVSCGTGTRLDGDKCVVDEDELEDKVSCGAGTRLDGEQCVVDQDELEDKVSCGEGTRLDGEQCIINDETQSLLDAANQDDDIISCGAGTRLDNGKCIINDETQQLLEDASNSNENNELVFSNLQNIINNRLDKNQNSLNTIEKTLRDLQNETDAEYAVLKSKLRDKRRVLVRRRDMLEDAKYNCQNNNKDCISDMNSYLNDQERENYKENYDCSITGQGPPQVTSAEKNKLLAAAKKEGPGGLIRRAFNPTSSVDNYIATAKPTFANALSLPPGIVKSLYDPPVYDNRNQLTGCYNKVTKNGVVQYELKSGGSDSDSENEGAVNMDIVCSADGLIADGGRCVIDSTRYKSISDINKDYLQKSSIGDVYMTQGRLNEIDVREIFILMNNKDLDKSGIFITDNEYKLYYSDEEISGSNNNYDKEDFRNIPYIYVTFEGNAPEQVGDKWRYKFISNKDIDREDRMQIQQYTYITPISEDDYRRHKTRGYGDDEKTYILDNTNNWREYSLNDNISSNFTSNREVRNKYNRKDESILKFVVDRDYISKEEIGYDDCPGQITCSTQFDNYLTPQQCNAQNLKCGDGTKERNGTCLADIKDDELLVCGENTEERNGRCVAKADSDVISTAADIVDII